MTRMAAHRVKSGETLWSITKRHYGVGHVWPSVYIYNNSPVVRQRRGHRGIVNPNLIHPGEVVYLPPLGSAILNDPAVQKQVTDQAAKASASGPANSHSGKAPPTAVMPQAARPATPATITSSHVPSSTAGRVAGKPASSPALSTKPGIDNPAQHLMVKGFAYAYKLDDIQLMVVHMNGFTAKIKLQGTLALQSDDKQPLVVFSDREAQLQSRRTADLAYGQLLSDQKVSWDRTKHTVSFECVLTSRANAHAVGTAISAGVSNGVPVLRSTIVFPKFGGYIGKYSYGSADFKVVLEISPDPDARTPPPAAAPVAAPVMSPTLVPAAPGFHMSHETEKVVTTVAVVAVVAVGIWFAWPVIAAYGLGSMATAGLAATAAGLTVWEGERSHIQTRTKGSPQA
jgi:hypothetical protein